MVEANKKQNVKKITRILVPVAGNPVDAEALEVAAAVARRAKATVLAVYVIEVKRSLPIGAQIEPEIEKGEAILDQAEQTAERLEMTFETELLQARAAGPALVDEAVERKVDLIIIGLPARGRMREFAIGLDVAHILKHAPCRVWVCREAVTES